MKQSINLQSFSRAIKKDQNLVLHLKEKTLFLDTLYEEVPLKQRMFHLKHPQVVLCDFCSKPALWTPYDKGYLSF